VAPSVARQPPTEAHPTDGYRLVTAWVQRRLGRAVNRKRVLRVMRERGLIQRRRRLDRRRRPGFFRVERPDQLWHLDMTSVWVAEHGWCYLMAAIDCCTREIVAWHLETRCRAREAIALIERAALERGIPPATLTLGTDNGSAFTARAFKAVLAALGIAHRRGGYGGCRVKPAIRGCCGSVGQTWLSSRSSTPLSHQTTAWRAALHGGVPRGVDAPDE
jgi:putative transposase